MAKSKIVKTVDKISNKVTDTYKRIEKFTVNKYTKIEDKFVEQYLAKDGETIAEAKIRLKKEAQQ